MALGSGLQISGFWIRDSGTDFQVDSLGFGVWGFVPRNPGFGVSGFGFGVSGFGFRVSGIGFLVPKCRSRFWDFGLCVSRLVCGVWCVVFGVIGVCRLVLGVWCFGFRNWFLVSGVWYWVFACFVLGVWCSEFRIWNFRSWATDSGLRVPVSRDDFRVSGLDFRFSISGPGLRVSGLGSRVSSFGYGAPNFGFWVPGLGLLVSNLGFQDSD